MSLPEELEKLRRLKDDGTLSQEEFESAKAKLIGGEASHGNGGQSQEKRSSSGCLTIFLVVGVLAILLFVIIGVTASGPTESSRPPLGVSIRASYDTLLITNTGSPAAAGESITIYLNGTPPFAYKAEATLPAIGQVAQVPLSLFVRRDGRRFKPEETAVTEAWIGNSTHDFEKHRFR